jgi:hypothetical protein
MTANSCKVNLDFQSDSFDVVINKGQFWWDYMVAV